MKEIIVTRCGNCPVFDRDRCLRLNMTMYEMDPPCTWAATGAKLTDSGFTEEFLQRHLPESANRIL